MIGFIRSFFKSKAGLAITLAFVVLIGIAFAASDVLVGNFSGGQSAQTIATVGNKTITTSDLRRETNNAFENVRRSNPNLTMPAFLAGGGVDQIIDRLINSYIIAEYGDLVEVATGKRLVDGEIAAIPGFSDLQGNFDERAFRDALRAQGLTEDKFRELVSLSLFENQLLPPLSIGVTLPSDVVSPYARLIVEGRKGKIAAIPSALFIDSAPVSDDVLKKFYADNAARFTIPEQRKVRYAVFNRTQVIDDVAISESDIKAAFESRREEFAARETRSVKQVILPTEQGAEALVKAVKDGKALDQAALDAGLASDTSDSLTKGELSNKASNAVADAVFAASEGDIASVAQSGLGWHVAQVTRINNIKARTLEDVRVQLEREVREEKARQALSDFTVTLEDRLTSGDDLATVAQSEGLNLKTSPFIISSGTSPTDRDFQAEPALRLILQDAFQIEEEGQGQLKETTAGLEFIVFDIPEIKASAPPPFAENRDAIQQAYRLDKAADKAESIARAVSAKAKDSASLAKALEDTGLKLPPVESVGVVREDLVKRGQRVPPPIALMFSMKEGSAKPLEGPGNQVWYVVYLDEIDEGDISDRPELLGQTASDLRAVYGRELGEQFLNAARKKIDVERNQSAIKAFSDTLTGANVPG